MLFNYLISMLEMVFDNISSVTLNCEKSVSHTPNIEEINSVIYLDS